MSSNKQIKIGALLSYVSIFLNIAVGLVYTPWMVEQIGQSQYGLYTLANSLITMLTVDFGLGSATSRYISKYRAEGKQEKIDHFLGAIYKIYLLISTAIFIIMFVLYFFLGQIYKELTPAELDRFKVVFVITGVYTVISFPFVTFDGVLVSYEKFIQLKLADIIYRIVFVVGTVVALSMGKDLYALVLIHTASGAVSLLFKYAVVKRNTPAKALLRGNHRDIYREVFSFSIWVTISLLASRLIFTITPSILGITAGTSAIAVFGVVSTTESYVYTLTAAIKGMFMPRISRLIVEDESKLEPLMLRVGRALFTLNGLIVAGFAVVGDQFVRLWMGEAYSEAYIGVLLVIIPGLFYNSLQIGDTTLIAKKKVHIQAIVTLITGVVNVILSIPLSMALGVIGACISIFIAYVVRAVIINVIYHRVLKFDMKRYVIECYLNPSLPIIISIVFGLGIDRLIPYSGWLGLILKALTVTVVYAILIFFLSLKKEERREIIGGLRKKR